MTKLKELAEGASLGGAYTIERWLREDRAGDFFSAVQADGERVLAKLAVENADSEVQYAIWQRSLALHHPHLLELRDAGRVELDDCNFFYAVFEYPDDALTSAMENLPLSEAETHAVWKAGMTALTYLHEHGLVHGSVDAANVVAVEETVKLATDQLRESDDPEARAEDTRQLGELVRSLRASESAPELPPVVLPPPVHRERPEEQTGEMKEMAARSFPKWIAAAVAILVLVIVLYNLGRKHATAVAPPAAPVAVRPAAAPAPRTIAGDWHVIAFTSHSRVSAEKKAQQINRKWPDLHAGVLEPRDRQGYFLVALGGGMTHEDADHLRNKARRLGLPRGTYVHNYSD